MFCSAVTRMQFGIASVPCIIPTGTWGDEQRGPGVQNLNHTYYGGSFLCQLLEKRKVYSKKNLGLCSLAPNQGCYLCTPSGAAPGTHSQLNDLNRKLEGYRATCLLQVQLRASWIPKEWHPVFKDLKLCQDGSNIVQLTAAKLSLPSHSFELNVLA